MTGTSDSLGYIERLYSKIICLYIDYIDLYIYTYFTYYSAMMRCWELRLVIGS